MVQQQNHTTARINGVKVFSATMAQERENLREKVTVSVRAHPQCKLEDTIVPQSSDEAFHCLAISVCFLDEKALRKSDTHSEVAPASLCACGRAHSGRRL